MPLPDLSQKNKSSDLFVVLTVLLFGVLQMSEAKDPAIKLFGRTIKLPEIHSEMADLVDSGQSTVLPDSFLAEGRDLNTSGAEQVSDKDPFEDKNENSTEEDEPVISNEVNDSNGMKENSKSLSMSDISASKKAEEEQNESQDKTLKKPDKILPCPRCNSMDTKFCYYNNYNVNQPRHFCKNCHRYWTAGGTMRNVPIGAGRRKNKSGIQSSLKPNDSSLALCDSTASVRNDPDQSVRDITSNGFHGLEGHRVSKDETSNDKRTISHQMACFPCAPWPYPAGFSVPYYSTATYWACTMPSAWNIPASQNNSDPSSSTLGKRSRDDSLIKENNPEKNLWVPKTLRIDDPEEAAKSSIWATLGIRNSNKVDPAVGGGLFKAFQSKGGVKTKILEASHLLQANPAALSRSLTFQEGL